MRRYVQRLRDKGTFSQNKELVHKRYRKRSFIHQKITEYGRSFSVHGLTKCMTGNLIESSLWAIILFVRIVLCCVVIYGLKKKYHRHAVYTEVKLQVTEKNFFPSVTVCEKQLLIDSYFAYCGASISQLRNSKFINSTYCQSYSNYKHMTSDETKYWSNGIFNITSCRTSSGSRNCNDKEHFMSLQRFNNSCIRWNYRGDFYATDQVNIAFAFKKPSHLQRKPDIFTYLHDPRINEIDVTGRISISPIYHYHLKIDKTYIKRLPHPFPANCSNEKRGDIYPGKYSRHTCIESYQHIEMYKFCGETFDYIRKHIPPDIIRKYKRNLTVFEFMNCTNDFSSHISYSYNCHFPCDDMELDIVSYSHDDGDITTDKYQLSFEFQRADGYKILEEKELYPSRQMACEIGGFMMLTMGMSLISFVEIVAYTGLVTIDKLKMYYSGRKKWFK